MLLIIIEKDVLWYLYAVIYVMYLGRIMITLFSKIHKLENTVLVRQYIHTCSDTDAHINNINIYVIQLIDHKKMYFSYAMQWHIPIFLIPPLIMYKMCLVMYCILLQTATLS